MLIPSRRRREEASHFTERTEWRAVRFQPWPWEGSRLFVLRSHRVDGVITALKLHRSRRGRVQVHLDGQPAFDLPKVLAAELRVGQSLTAAEVEALQRRAEEEAAHQHALRLLSWRQRSEEEVRRALSRRKVTPEAQEGALRRLRQAGLLDDRRFARAWVENQQAFRPRSRRALRQELRSKGVAQEVVESALAGLDDEAAALRAAAKPAGRLRGLSQNIFRRRLAAALARRGFDHVVIQSVVARLWREAVESGGESEDVKWNFPG